MTSEDKHQVPGCLHLRLLESRIWNEAPFTGVKYYTSQASLLASVRGVLTTACSAHGEISLCSLHSPEPFPLRRKEFEEFRPFRDRSKLSLSRAGACLSVCWYKSISKKWETISLHSGGRAHLYGVFSKCFLILAVPLRTNMHEAQ